MLNLRTMPPDMVDLGLAFIFAGVAAGWFASRPSTHRVTMLVGAAAMASLLLFMMRASRAGCAGGGCIGDMFALMFMGPIGLIGMGMVLGSVIHLVQRTVLDVFKKRWLSIVAALALLLMLVVVAANLSHIAHENPRYKDRDERLRKLLLRTEALKKRSEAARSRSGG